MPLFRTDSGIKRLNYFLTAVLFVTIILFIVSFFARKVFPTAQEILPPLLQEPIQLAAGRAEFIFRYRGSAYQVAPVAEYQIAGLVVSHNQIDSLMDIYHTSDSVDLKDICVIWGKNLQTDDFRSVSFWSNAWTCHWGYYDGIDFSNREVANNHLLAADTKIQKQIRNLHIGDQIVLQGMLVDYSLEGSSFTRVSSRSRDDTGNGACEVVFVENVKVLKSAHPYWNVIYAYGGWAIGFLILLKIILFFKSSHREKNSFDDHERERKERLRRREELIYGVKKDDT